MKEQIHLSYSDIEEIRKLLNNGEKIYAIKIIKDATGLGLTESKRIVEQIEKGKTDFTIEKKSGGCYIATCVYGSYDCPEVWTLRRYRDYSLASNFFGRTFIKIYYAISPTLVKLFGQTKWFKKMWKKKLDRMVTKLQDKGFENTPYND